MKRANGRARGIVSVVATLMVVVISCGRIALSKDVAEESPKSPATPGSKHPDTRTTAVDYGALLKAARGGDCRAMVRVGIALECGQGVAANHEEAHRWYQRSADGFDSLGMSRLGWSFINGVGVPVDMKKGRHWCSLGAVAGNSFSRGRVAAYGWSEPKGHVEAFRWYRESAEEGDPRGAYFTAKYNSLGRGGAEKSAAQASRWLRWGAEMGDPSCMQQLSGCLYDGLGTTPDTIEAEKWMRESARRSDVRGMYSLGWRLYHGRGLVSDPKTAVDWWRKASVSHQAGHDYAIYGLGLAHSDGRGVPRDQSGALKLFRIAADLGNEHAMYRLGCAFRDGEGTGKDLHRAVAWYRRGEKKGHAGCQRELTRLNGEVGARKKTAAGRNATAPRKPVSSADVAPGF